MDVFSPQADSGVQGRPAAINGVPAETDLGRPDAGVLGPALFHGRPAHLITALDMTEQVVMDGERGQSEGERREATARRQTFLRDILLRDILASVTEDRLLLSNSSTPLPTRLSEALR